MPKGWHVLSRKTPQVDGFAKLGAENYFETWSESARRYRRKWRDEFLDKTYSIEQISPKEFDSGYMQSSVGKKLKRLFPDLVARKLAAGVAVELWGARHKDSGEIVAGVATITSPTHRASYYLCGFILEKYADAPVMVGLMDHWYRRGLEANLQYLHFGRFWQKGDPKEWKGFSEFKSKFGLEYIAYPPTLVRLARGKLF